MSKRTVIAILGGVLLLGATVFVVIEVNENRVELEKLVGGVASAEEFVDEKVETEKPFEVIKSGNEAEEELTTQEAVGAVAAGDEVTQPGEEVTEDTEDVTEMTEISPTKMDPVGFSPFLVVDAPKLCEKGFRLSSNKQKCLKIQ